MIDLIYRIKCILRRSGKLYQGRVRYSLVMWMQDLLSEDSGDSKEACTLPMYYDWLRLMGCPQWFLDFSHYVFWIRSRDLRCHFEAFAAVPFSPSSSPVPLRLAGALWFVSEFWSSWSSGGCSCHGHLAEFDVRVSATKSFLPWMAWELPNFGSEVRGLSSRTDVLAINKVSGLSWNGYWRRTTFWIQRESMWIYVKLCEADVVEIWIGTYWNKIGTASEHHGLQCSDVDQILIRCCSDLLESEPKSEQIFWNRCVWSVWFFVVF